MGMNVLSATLVASGAARLPDLVSGQGKPDLEIISNLLPREAANENTRAAIFCKRLVNSIILKISK